MASFGEMLAELRLDRKMTQKNLADILHVSVSTISNYERNVYFPEVEKLTNLADFFQVTVDYLLGRSEFNFLPDVFSEVIVNDKTVGDIIKIFRQLPEENKKALLLIMGDMEFHIAVNQYGKKENT